MRSNKIKNFTLFEFYFLLLETHYFILKAQQSVYLDQIQLRFTGEKLRLKETNVTKWGRKKKTDKSELASPPSTYY